ncbi:MAG TPA: hypothetical protein VFK06_15905 [Candidatus Angelobacter sp.]|nr:hypothetical protein [Candidatus Angelobacter sp.]
MVKAKILAALRECALKKGRIPTYAEAHKSCKVTRYWIRKHFVSLAHALREAGLSKSGPGHRLETADLMADWAATALKLGKIPTETEYKRTGQFSVHPLKKRCKSWRAVPEHFRAFVRECKAEEKWGPVLAMIENREKLGAVAGSLAPSYPRADAPPINGPRDRRKIRLDRPIYGPPSPFSGLIYEPVNEAGVIFVFGRLAEKLGIHVERMQTGFPDCEAMREVETGKWQRVRIEFEFESRNFLVHKHQPEGCDIIICWTHNWPECPSHLEVVELKRVARVV